MQYTTLIRSKPLLSKVMIVTAIFLLVISLGAALIFSFLGIGLEEDNYRNIAVWQHILLTGEYLQSRTPGHVASELLIGFLTSLLPSSAANLIIAACSVSSLIFFYFLTRPSIGAVAALIAITFVASNPYWIGFASASDETNLATFFFIAGLAALKWRAPAATALLFALATSARAEYGPLSGLLLLGLGGMHSAASRRWIDGLIYSALFGVICFLLWLPVLISQQMTFAFLERMTKITGGVSEILVRFFYKVAMFFGLPATAILAAVAMSVVWVVWRNKVGRPPPEMSWLKRLRSGSFETWLAGLITTYFLLFFSTYPLVINPLVPILYSVPVFFLALKVKPWLILCAACAQFLTWFVSPAVLRIDYESVGIGYKTKPVAARIDPHLAPGVLVKEWNERHLRDSFYLPRLPSPVPLQDTFEYASRTTERGTIRHIGDVVDFYINDD